VQALDGICFGLRVANIGSVGEKRFVESVTAYADQGILVRPRASLGADRVRRPRPAQAGEKAMAEMRGRELRSLPKPAYRTDPIRPVSVPADSRYP